jgi:hypothetical protein
VSVRIERVLRAFEQRLLCAFHGALFLARIGVRIAWSAILRAHWGAIAAMDFFTVEVVTWTGLVRYHVLFVIDLASRRVEIAGIVHSISSSVDEASRAQPHPCRRWVSA